ncbi:hypothetical protein CIP106467_0523 [Citrobacter europaeus]|nr:hypothetical protein CIP106467_0523 [Citrobacter europaeus]
MSNKQHEIISKQAQANLGILHCIAPTLYGGLYTPGLSNPDCTVA